MQLIEVKFPCNITQNSQRSVVMEAGIALTNKPLVSMETLDAMAPELGGRDIEEIRDAIEAFAHNEIIRRSIIVGAPKDVGAGVIEELARANKS